VELLAFFANALDVPAQQVFPGRRRRLLPDFILRWSDEYPVTEAHSSQPGLIRATGRAGEHRPGGFALVLGRRMKEGGLPPLAQNADFPRFESHLLDVRTGS
jgi:hypothetical protein